VADPIPRIKNTEGATQQNSAVTDDIKLYFTIYFTIIIFKNKLIKI
jgi:hypothetical protein